MKKNDGRSPVICFFVGGGRAGPRKRPEWVPSPSACATRLAFLFFRPRASVRALCSHAADFLRGSSLVLEIERDAYVLAGNWRRLTCLVSLRVRTKIGS